MSSDGYVQCEDVDLAYIVRGPVNHFCSINGGPGFPAHHFAPVAELLSNELSVEVIRFDQRGTGRSILTTPTPDQFTLDLFVADMEALRKKLGFPRWIVMGHSFGAILAMALAARHPFAIQHLILSAPAGIDTGFQQRLEVGIQKRLSPNEQAALAAAIASPASYQRQLDILSIILSAYVLNREALAGLRAAAIESRVYRPDISEMVWEALNTGNGYDLKPEIRGLAVPTLILQGCHDPIGSETIDEICSMIPTATRITVPDASHYPWIDNRNAYLSAISDAIARH
jgi:proline iminopeptidase